MVVHAVCKVSCCSCDCPPVTVVHGIAICLSAYIQGSDTEAKLSDIWTALSNRIKQDSSCSFILQQHFFSCLGTEKAETVVYIYSRALLHRNSWSCECSLPPHLLV